MSEVDLLDELYPGCPRGCGRSMDDCDEAEDGGQCEGSGLVQRLEHDLDKAKKRLAKAKRQVDETEAVREENDRLHKLVDDMRQGDGHQVCRTELAEAQGKLARIEELCRTANTFVNRDSVFRILNGDAPAAAATDTAAELIHQAWGLIANAGWDAGRGLVNLDKTEGWHDAAIRWRDAFHAWLDHGAATTETPDEYNLPSQGEVIGHTTIHVRSHGKLEPSLHLPEYDAELADINARHAADKRVLGAAEALYAAVDVAEEDSDWDEEPFTTLLMELCQAAKARRALDSQTGDKSTPDTPHSALAADHPTCPNVSFYHRPCTLPAHGWQQPCKFADPGTEYDLNSTILRDMLEAVTAGGSTAVAAVGRWIECLMHRRAREAAEVGLGYRVTVDREAAIEAVRGEMEILLDYLAQRATELAGGSGEGREGGRG